MLTGYGNIATSRDLCSSGNILAKAAVSLMIRSIRADDLGLRVLTILFCRNETIIGLTLLWRCAGKKRGPRVWLIDHRAVYGIGGGARR